MPVSDASDIVLADDPGGQTTRFVNALGAFPSGLPDRRDTAKLTVAGVPVDVMAVPDPGHVGANPAERAFDQVRSWAIHTATSETIVVTGRRPSRSQDETALAGASVKVATAGALIAMKIVAIPGAGAPHTPRRCCRTASTSSDWWPGMIWMSSWTS